jgi:hypothetical protein
MPNRLTRPGTLAYALIAVCLAAQVVQIVRLEGVWGTGQTWVAVVLAGIGLASFALFASSAVTRIPLIESSTPGPGDDHLLSRGAWVVIGLTVLGVVVVAVSSLDSFGLWPNLPAAFTPFWVRRLETAYFEGVEETRRAAAARADGL